MVQWQKNTIVRVYLFSKNYRNEWFFLDETEKRIVPLSWSDSLVFFLSFWGCFTLAILVRVKEALSIMNFNLKENSYCVNHKPIVDMIETIEHFAQTQPSYPVYNVLGQEHTYGDLKADSDSLAAAIDQLDLPEKSPVVVLVAKNMKCWQLL